MSTVSICIPTYNRKNYLRETLDSVFAQTYKDYEVVVVDDGSTDGTREMIEDANYNIRYYRQENQGEPATCNRLVQLAKGPYVSFIHSDDLLVPNAIERMVRAVDAEQGDVVVYGNYLRIDEHGNPCGGSKRKLYSGYITRYLFEDIIVHPNGSMFPKKALEEAGGFDTTLPACYDYKLELQISLKYPFIALSEPTFKRRRHSGNTSQDSFVNRKAELDMLTDFYYNGGGNEAIPTKTARKRLSKESYRAARWAVNEGLYDQARQLFRRSWQEYANLKALIHWARAAVAK